MYDRDCCLSPNFLGLIRKRKNISHFFRGRDLKNNKKGSISRLATISLLLSQVISSLLCRFGTVIDSFELMIHESFSNEERKKLKKQKKFKQIFDYGSLGTSENSRKEPDHLNEKEDCQKSPCRTSSIVVRNFVEPCDLLVDTRYLQQSSLLLLSCVLILLQPLNKLQ